MSGKRKPQSSRHNYRRTIDHRGAWLKFASVLLMLTLAGLGLAYFRGWGVFHNGYYERNLQAVGGDYYAAYRRDILARYGLEATIERLKEAETTGGINLTLQDILRYSNGQLAQTYGKRLAQCQSGQTLVRITPQAPYGEQDFELGLALRCY